MKVFPVLWENVETKLDLTLTSYETAEPKDSLIRIQLTNERDTRWRHPVQPVTGSVKMNSDINYPDNPKHLLDFKIQSGENVVADFDGTRTFSE